MTAGLNQETKDGVLTLTIARPERENRVSPAVGLGLRNALEAARRDAAIRAVVLTSSGPMFCLGGEIDGFPGGSPVQYLDFARSFGDIATAMARLGKPLIGAINGDALAGGFALLAGCDLAIGIEGARFGLPELDYGLFPLMALASTHDLLPSKVLFEIIYEQRMLTAQDALGYGLVNKVVPRERLAAETQAMARRAASLSGVAVGIGRDAFYAMKGMTPAAALDHARLALTAMLSTEDGKEAGYAKRDHRPPRYSGR